MAERLARPADGNHLSMRRGIKNGSDLVRAGRDDLTIFDDHRAKGPPRPLFTFSTAS